MNVAEYSLLLIAYIGYINCLHTHKSVAILILYMK